jgi:hypothetical protein
MYEENEENTCQICLEFYDSIKKIPKRLECCNQIFCLQCLDDIYRKNHDIIHCPICRLTIKKSPKDLKVVKECLEVKSMVTCPSCFRSIKNTQLKLTINDSNPAILCYQCCNTPDTPDLDIYLSNLLDEMSYFHSAYCNLNIKGIEKELERLSQISVDNIINKIRNGLYERVKNRLNTIIQTKVLSVSLEELNVKINQLNSNLNELKAIKDVKNSDYPNVVSSIDFYIRNNEILKHNSLNLSKVVQAAQSANDFVKLDDNVKPIEIEDFIHRLLVFNVKNSSFRAYENECFQTGINFIDSKLNNKFDFSELNKDVINSFHSSAEKAKWTPFDDDLV